jgi:hypothetical protein
MSMYVIALFYSLKERVISGVWSEASRPRHRIDVSVQAAVKPWLSGMCRQSLTWVVDSSLKACRNQDSPTPNPVPHIPDASINIPVILTRAFPSCWSVQEATDEKGETKHQTRSVVCRGCRYTDSRLRIMAVRMHAFPRERLASQDSEHDLTGVSNVIVSRRGAILTLTSAAREALCPSLSKLHWGYSVSGTQWQASQPRMPSSAPAKRCLTPLQTVNPIQCQSSWPSPSSSVLHTPAAILVPAELPTYVILAHSLIPRNTCLPRWFRFQLQCNWPWSSCSSLELAAGAWKGQLEKVGFQGAFCIPSACGKWERGNGRNDAQPCLPQLGCDL